MSNPLENSDLFNFDICEKVHIKICNSMSNAGAIVRPLTKTNLMSYSLEYAASLEHYYKYVEDKKN